MKKLFLLMVLAFWLGTSCLWVSCSYENHDNPVEYPDLEPEPEPEPEPVPEQNAEYVAALKEPNCYMVQAGEAVSIPVMKAYAVWELFASELENVEMENQVPEPVLLWQDAQSLITNVGLIPGETHEKDNITVSVSGSVKSGNALVGVKIAGEIRWSWHIWVTPYNPDKDPVAMGRIYPYDNNGDGVDDYIFMDRNLGAVNTTVNLGTTMADSLAACGLLYQWGRKDPFPGDSKFKYSTNNNPYYDSKPIYTIENVLLTEGSQNGGTGIRSVKADMDQTRTSLTKSIVNPLTVLLGPYGYNDWLEERCDTLWNNQKGGKAPFDPCPEGWRVPINKNGTYPWNGFELATTEYSPLGVFPMAGFRYCVGGGILKNSGHTAEVWIGDVNANFTGNARYLSIYYDYAHRAIVKADVGARSNAASIRCVKE